MVDESRSISWPTKTNIVLILGGYVFVWLLYGLVVGWWFSDQRAGIFGDMFGGFTALVTGLSFLGVIVALFLQMKQVAMQSQELRMQREELRLQRVEMKKMADIQEKQLEHFQERDAKEEQASIRHLCFLAGKIWRMVEELGDDHLKSRDTAIWSEEDEQQLLELANMANASAAYHADVAVSQLTQVRLIHGLSGISVLNYEVEGCYQKCRREAVNQLSTLDIHIRQEPGYRKFHPEKK